MQSNIRQFNLFHLYKISIALTKILSKNKSFINKIQDLILEFREELVQIQYFKEIIHYSIIPHPLQFKMNNKDQQTFSINQVTTINHYSAKLKVMFLKTHSFHQVNLIYR